MDTVLPSSLGFADDGQAWGALGHSKGLLTLLEKRSPRLADWFAYGHFAQDLPPTPRMLPALKNIHPVQNYVVPATVEAYAAGIKGAPKESHELFPTLFRVDGATFIYQGTHRLAALASKNEAFYFGWFLDFDARIARG